jgi:pimeloyl-ACP methyl ester carboxylesterase
MVLSWATPFAEHFTVYRVARRSGLTPGTTMADIAADYATVIERDIGDPVLIHGTSTGGAVGLQLSIDHPHLVQRLVVGAAACRLSPHGRALMARVARRIRDGDVRGASALMAESLVPRRLAYAGRGVGWAMGGRLASDDLSDMVITIAAEDSFNAEPSLSRVQAPTLVLGGTADVFYSTDLFRRTADVIPQGRAVIFPGKTHASVAGSKVAAGTALGFLIGG